METSYRYETDTASDEPDYYIALLPEEPECEIGILWRAIAPTERDRIYNKHTKRNGKLNNQAFIEELAGRCVKGIKGATPAQIKQFGVLALSDAKLARAEADFAKRGWSETPFSADFLDQLCKESDKFRSQVLDFSTQIELIEQARKVWLGKASRTGRPGAETAAN